HTLYLPEEVEKLKRQYGEQGGDATPRPAPVAPPHSAPAPRPASMTSAPVQASPAHDGEIAALRHEIAELRTTVAQLRCDLADVVGQSQKSADQIDELRQALGG